MWRDRNPEIFPGMNPHNLSNQRRFIIKGNKLTASGKIEQIAADVAYRIEKYQCIDDDHAYHRPVVPYVINQPISRSEKKKTEAEVIKSMEKKIFVKFNEVRYCKFEIRKTLNKIKNIKTSFQRDGIGEQGTE